MLKSAAYFPHRLFSWFLIQQTLFFVTVLVLLDTAVYIWLARSGFDAEALSLARFVLGVTSVAAFGIAALVSFFVARRLVLPLGRLIDKTHRLREFPFGHEESEPEVLTFDEPGEWFELERALNRLGRDLRHKTIRLSREKTELRAIMAAVTEAVLAITAERGLLFMNPQFAYLFNLESGGKPTHITELIRSDAIMAAYDEVLATGQAARSEAEVVVRGERLPRILQLSVAPLKKKHNQEVYGAVGIFHDITELKQAERIRIEFVGNVSHELRTPLTAINGFLHTVVDDFARGETEQAGEFLDIVVENVARLRGLVEDLLDLSSLESGKELRFEDVDVRELTEAVLKQVPAETHNVHLKFDFDRLHADAHRLEQVLRNLMENAVRYVPEGRDIEIAWTESAGRRELRVKDNGPGIGPEHLARLFERFYRVDQARSRRHGGTGIGLSLVKHIVQRHGGQVVVQSQVGEGSEFICEFPG